MPLFCAPADRARACLHRSQPAARIPCAGERDSPTLRAGTRPLGAPRRRTAFAAPPPPFHAPPTPAGLNQGLRGRVRHEDRQPGDLLLDLRGSWCSSRQSQAPRGQIKERESLRILVPCRASGPRPGDLGSCPSPRGPSARGGPYSADPPRPCSPVDTLFFLLLSRALGPRWSSPSRNNTLAPREPSILSEVRTGLRTGALLPFFASLAPGSSKVATAFDRHPAAGAGRASCCRLATKLPRQMDGGRARRGDEVLLAELVASCAGAQVI